MNNITAYIGLGANLGQAQNTLLQAAQQLEAHKGINQLRLSPFYGSAPVDSSGPDYINAVAEIKTELNALNLLAVLQEIETLHGRIRPFKNAPRTLDLDLLWYNNQNINLAQLTVPHPRMHLRAFVLKPLQDLAPNLNLAQGSIAKLLEDCAEQRIELLKT